ncbi:hypothetical protein TVAG_235000 [Trichomonas vaginalis G3]|uniref:Uncharacterized protein n=1 Tax=Trichomonas vaginalis (strain ATCC PRA-98 / G3) TaxID=412133 RepID=A2DPL9_TRIV3|nr:hypothetical protein TVAG_235000 [Trichomonas vaginalis G3]|eukprot:XP_001329754.1 hypothetical protein [Trichomonas vaginalis G3]
MSESGKCTLKQDFILYSLPYAGVEEQPELPPQACFYDSKLPDKVYSPNYDDALIRGIVALSQKVEKDKEKVKKPNESLLEIAKLEFEAENDKIRNYIDIEIENLKREIISGAIFENTLDDFETTIAYKINIGRSAAITGKEAASLLRSLNK